MGQKKHNRESQIYDNLASSCIQSHDVLQSSTYEANSPANMDNTSLMSPTQLLSDMLHHCGVSTDDLPALADRAKPSSRLQGNSASGTAGSSLTRGKLREAASFASHELTLKKTSNKPGTNLLNIEDEANGDYVDLIPLLTGNMQSSTHNNRNNHTNSQVM